MLSLEASYGKTAWLDSLPAYDQSLGVDQLLELSRKVLEGDNHYWRGCAFPDRDHTRFVAYQTYEDQFSVDPGSWLMSMTAYCNSLPENQAPPDNSGFKLQLYDAGAKTPLMIRTFAQHSTIAGSMAPVTPGGVAQPCFGPGFLQSPLVICDPGQITVQITNLANMSADIQLLLVFAVPVNRTSVSQNELSWKQ